ncbi:MAG TPA: hypothetical protein VH583_15350 [Vicinamibacterales bacterium]
MGFRMISFIVLAVSMVLPAASARAQTTATVTSADIQRLQDGITEASRDIDQARTRDATLADQLQKELNDVRDTTAYLKVKLQRNESIARSDYTDLRDRLDNIRDRARGESTGGYTPPAAAPSNPGEVPVGTELDVRLQAPLSSATAKVEDRFNATTVVDLKDRQGTVMIPAGSVMSGVVSSVTKATRTERTGKLTVSFDRVTVDGVSLPMRGTVTQAIESEGIKGEIGKIGVGAGAGAILGAILGGAKGALAGVLIGGGGTIVATEGKDAELPAGAILRVRLDSPLDLGK